MKKLVLASALLAANVFAAAPNGKALFETNCASCHGNDGKAQTDVGKAVKARNLIVDEFKQVKDKKKGVTEDDISNTIKTGIPGTGMAAFPSISEPDRKAIAKYVIELRKKK